MKTKFFSSGAKGLMKFALVLFGALIFFLILIKISGATTVKERQEKERRYIAATAAENRAIDSIHFTDNVWESYKISLINKRMYSRINAEIAAFYPAKFNRVIYLHNTDSESMAMLSIVWLKKGANLSDFAPQFKQYNPNKLANAKTFLITIPAMKKLIKILNKQGVLISGTEIIGEYIYII